MRSILTVTTAAMSYDLTTLAVVKDELNITDGSKDAVLGRYISSASLAAMQYCNRVFSVETLTEQFYQHGMHRLVRGGVKPLQLVRWPIVSITSVTEDSVLLVENTDFVTDGTNGQLTRLDSSVASTGIEAYWRPLPLTVVYKAGYTAIPLDIQDAIVRMVSKRFIAKGRDPSLRQRDVPGVLSESYWIATGADSGNMTPDIADILDNYRTPNFA